MCCEKLPNLASFVKKFTDSTQIMNRLMFIVMNWLQLVISDTLRDSGSDERLINILGNKE